MLQPESISFLIEQFAKTLESHGHSIMVAVHVDGDRVLAGVNTKSVHITNKMMQALANVAAETGAGIVSASAQDAFKVLIDEMNQERPGK